MRKKKLNISTIWVVAVLLVIAFAMRSFSRQSGLPKGSEEGIVQQKQNEEGEASWTAMPPSWGNVSVGYKRRHRTCAAGRLRGFSSGVLPYRAVRRCRAWWSTTFRPPRFAYAGRCPPPCPSAILTAARMSA